MIIYFFFTSGVRLLANKYIIYALQIGLHGNKLYDGNFFQDRAVVIDMIFSWVGVTLLGYLEDNRIYSHANFRF